MESGNNLITPNVITTGWHVPPYLVSSQNRVRYKTSWLVEDNYRSSVPITVSRERSSETSVSIGFTGDNILRTSMGFSASYSAKQTAKISIGATIPGWTAWGTRPYIRYRLENWRGVRFTAIQIGSKMYFQYETVTGTNNVLRTRANDYWSRTNTQENRNASTPSPPTGAP